MAKVFSKKITPVFFLVLIILGLAFVLRILFLNHNLFFGWEQGRDFLKLKEIAAGDLALIGPKTDIDGVFHGVLSYYLLLPLFLFFSGDPFLVLICLIAFNVLAIYFLFLSLKGLFNQRIALIGILLYSFSYSAIIYSRWLSNPNLVPGLTIFLIYFLAKAKKQAGFLIGSAISWSVIFHLSSITALILLPPIVVFLILEKGKIKPTWKQIFILLVVLFFLFSPYLLFDLLYNNILIKGVLNYLSSRIGGETYRLSYFAEFFNELKDFFLPTIVQSNLTIYFLLTIFTVVYLIVLWTSKKNKNGYLVLFFLISGPAIFFLLGIRPLRHFFIILPLFLSISLALVIDWLWQQKLGVLGILILLLVVVGNFRLFQERIPINKANFLHHSQYTYLADMKAAIEYIYQDANGLGFSYDYYTIPYFKNEGWRYLFEWYGQKKYGYLPGKNRTDPFYVIIEPNEAIPVHRDNWYGEFKKNLDLLSTLEFGKITVEKRQVHIPEK